MSTDERVKHLHGTSDLEKWTEVWRAHSGESGEKYCFPWADEVLIEELGSLIGMESHAFV